MILAGLVAALVGIAAPGHAAVTVNLGINLGVPPPLVIVPGTAVAYAPGVAANYFFYAGQYYVFNGGVWYMAPRFNGPWVALAPAYVPRPVLAVPVQYYRRVPEGWKHWRRQEPPRWANTWGRQWQEHGGDHRGEPGEPHRGDRR
jgi:hypothetical protein